jgi:hypothetical protein
MLMLSTNFSLLLLFSMPCNNENTLFPPAELGNLNILGISLSVSIDEEKRF